MRKLAITMLVILCGISSTAQAYLSRDAKANLSQMRASMLDHEPSGVSRSGTIATNLRATITVVKSVSKSCRMFDERIEQLQRDWQTKTFIVQSVVRSLRKVACRTGQNSFGLGIWKVQGGQVRQAQAQRKPCRITTSSSTTRQSPNLRGVLARAKGGGIGYNLDRILQVALEQAVPRSTSRTSNRCSEQY